MKVKLICEQHDEWLGVMDELPRLVRVEGNLWEVDLSGMGCPQGDNCQTTWVCQYVSE